VLDRYVAHYNHRRPHRARQLTPPRPDHPIRNRAARRYAVDRSSVD
jgi:hypothetical protein